MKTVRLTTCSNTFEANVLKGALEAAGINCIIQGENFANVYGNIITALAPDILVNEEDLDTARTIIQEALK